MFASRRAAFRTFGFGRTRRPSDIDAGASADVAVPEVQDAPVFECYVCDSPMALVEDADIPELGVKDLRRHTMRCETCGMMADRIYHHMIGYDRGLVL